MRKVVHFGSFRPKLLAQGAQDGAFREFSAPIFPFSHHLRPFSHPSSAQSGAFQEPLAASQPMYAQPHAPR